MGPGDLQQLLTGLRLPSDPRLIAGADRAEDAGVFRLDDRTGLVLTLDFFTPIVDDPYQFGAIAAANALSDVYAMGGTPLAALNICGFPPKEDKVLLRAILQGGADKVAEAGAVIAGGHSIKDEELKYGLAVIGHVHPERMMENRGARPGDQLVLTKPLGTGLLSTARRKDAIKEAEFEPAIQAMLELNRTACAAMLEFGAHGATDVTGFGLLGHAQEMACASGVALRINLNSIPLLPGAMKAAVGGHTPGGARNNRTHFGPFVDGEPREESWWWILFDPQTSGGLLISVPEKNAKGLVDQLSKQGLTAAVIGDALLEPAGRIILHE